MKVALIQFNASADKKQNLIRAQHMTLEAIRRKARWVLLPEVFSFRGDLRNKNLLNHVVESIPGQTTQIFSKFAQDHKTSIFLGSMFEKGPKQKMYNTSVVISCDGRLVKYRKIHLFDARLGDKIIRESDYMAAGLKPQMIVVDGFNVGLSVCYDLRFPDLYQEYAQNGATALLAPSCFTKTTGQAHWEVLLRARAIENLSYVLAANQVGKDARGIQSYANSMVIDPWGNVIARGSSNKEEIIYADIFLENVKKAREKLPGIIKGE